jgi:hypothetical protein
MFGEEYEKDILKISVLDNTISRRILNISQDVDSQAIDHIKKAFFFAIHLD